MEILLVSKVMKIITGNGTSETKGIFSGLGIVSLMASSNESRISNNSYDYATITGVDVHRTC